MSDNSSQQPQNPRIVFVDSGIGGIPYLDAFAKQRPNFDLHYVCDTLGFPYGTRENEYLLKHSTKLVRQIIKDINPDCIVLACNTLSVACLAQLRSQFTIPFVGVVPAVKRAIDDDRKRIYLMGTTNTSQSPETAELIRRHKQEGQLFFMKGYSELVEYIEHFVLNQEEAYLGYIAGIISHLANEVQNLNADALILACTHFVHCKSLIKRELSDKHSGDTVVYDSVDGVVQRLCNLYPNPEKKNSRSTASPLSFYCTNNKRHDLYSNFAESKSMSYARTLDIDE